MGKETKGVRASGHWSHAGNLRGWRPDAELFLSWFWDSLVGSPGGSCLLGFGAQERGPWAGAEHYRQCCPGKGDQLSVLPPVTLVTLFDL